MKNDLVIIGAGGHAKVVISTALACELNISCVLDDDPVKWGTYILGFEIIGPIKDSLSKGIIAIGDNQVRKKIAGRLQNFRWVSILHPFTFVHPSATVGEGSVIFAGSIIQPDVKIGRHVIINTGVTIDHDCVIGDFVHLAPGTNIAGGVTIGEGTFIGIGAKVAEGLTIGKWCKIGAGSVVIRNVGDYSKVAGIPARPIGET